MDSRPPTDDRDPARTAISPAPADDRPGAVAAGPGATPIELGSLLRESWATFAANWPACLVVYWGAVAASWLILELLIVTLAGLNAMAGEPGLTPFLEFIRFLGIFLIPAWLWIGQNLALLRIARREPVTLEDLFRGGPSLLTVLLAIGVLLSVTCIPWMVIYALAEMLMFFKGGDALALMLRHLLPETTPDLLSAFGGDLLASIAISIGVLGLFWAAFLAVTARLGQFPFLIIDREAGVLESHRTSWRLTRGHGATVFLVYLSQFAINLAGCLVLYVGLFVTLPLTALISAVTYDALSARTDPAAELNPEN